MKDNQKLIERIERLEARNKKVEADKAWEIGWLRKVLIMLLTYSVVVVYLRFVVHINPWFDGFVPVIGYFLSTQTVSLVKKHWIAKLR